MQWDQRLPEISLCVTIFLGKMTFSIYTKIQDGGQNLEKSKFFRGPRRVVLSIQRVQNLHKITLSLMVFQINDIFHFL